MFQTPLRREVLAVRLEALFIAELLCVLRILTYFSQRKGFEAQFCWEDCLTMVIGLGASMALLRSSALGAGCRTVNRLLSTSGLIQGCCLSSSKVALNRDCLNVSFCQQLACRFYCLWPILLLALLCCRRAKYVVPAAFDEGLTSFCLHKLPELLKVQTFEEVRLHVMLHHAYMTETSAVASWQRTHLVVGSILKIDCKKLASSLEKQRGSWYVPWLTLDTRIEYSGP